MRTKIVLHIEDEFNHWANLNESIEGAILEYLALGDDLRAYNSFVYIEPESEKVSPAITRMTWKDGQKKELIWVLNYDNSIEKLKEMKVFERTKPEDRFFILDASKKSDKSDDPDKTIVQNFEAIDELLYDTDSRVRVFTAYKRDISAGLWDLKLPFKINGQVKDKRNLNDMLHLVISKTGIAGRNSELPADLMDLLLEFVMES